MLFRTFGAGLCGTEGFPVCCEADVENGFPQINFIGSLSQSVRESSDRVRTAIANTGLRLEPRHVTISLSPGDVRKEGCAYDLPVAAALLGAYGYLPDTLTENALLVGELSLGGEILPVNGVIAMVSAARDAGFARCFRISWRARAARPVSRPAWKRPSTSRAARWRGHSASPPRGRATITRALPSSDGTTGRQ